MFTELGRDHVLTMIAVSLTYFKMSSRRFVDAVPMLIMHHLMGRWAASIRTQTVCTHLIMYPECHSSKRLMAA